MLIILYFTKGPPYITSTHHVPYTIIMILLTISLVLSLHPWGGSYFHLIIILEVLLPMCEPQVCHLLAE